MTDMTWLADQARQIHETFNGLFYALATVLLLLGTVVEYFKFPLGGTPQFGVLVGRTLIAAIMLNTYPEVSNTVAEITDAFASQLGDLNQFKHVLSELGDKIPGFSLSWTSIKDNIVLIFTFVTFFILYFSVYIADAVIMYAWTLLYVFSPLMIAMYILPATAGATKTIYRSLFEIGAWKIVWSVLATLLWSSALSNMNKPDHNINFLTVIAFNLILAASLLLTPLVVNALTSGSIASLAGNLGGLASGSAFFNPGQIASNFGQKVKNNVQFKGNQMYESGKTSLKEKYFSPPPVKSAMADHVSKFEAQNNQIYKNQSNSKPEKPLTS